MAKVSRVGRPTKFTPETKKKLLDAIRMGNYREPSCAFAGISVSTFYAWLDKGKQQKKGQFVEFLEAVEHAEAEAEVRMVAQWQAHIPRDWRAARDFLARRYPERWGLRARVGLGHVGEVTHVHEANSITEKLIADPDFLTAIQIAADQILEKRQDNHSHG
ncbi:MAG: hypothetical protein QM401_12555 [Bacillota bacterium]|nr:hypothetical protein [Bacillota bacterium]